MTLYVAVLESINTDVGITVGSSNCICKEVVVKLGKSCFGKLVSRRVELVEGIITQLRLLKRSNLKAGNEDIAIPLNDVTGLNSVVKSVLFISKLLISDVDVVKLEIVVGVRAELELAGCDHVACKVALITCSGHSALLEGLEESTVQEHVNVAGAIIINNRYVNEIFRCIVSKCVAGAPKTATAGVSVNDLRSKLPAVILLGLAGFGIETHVSTGNMLVSDIVI